MKTGIFEHEGELDNIGESDPLFMAKSRELRFQVQQELWPVADIRELMALAKAEADTFRLLIRAGDIPSKANGEAVEPVVAICWGLRHGKQAAAMYQPYLSQENKARLQAMIDGGGYVIAAECSDASQVQQCSAKVAPEAQEDAKAAIRENDATATWKKEARAIGEEWMLEEEKKTGERPSVARIAAYVEGELSNRFIVGPRGKFLVKETIKREALRGLTGRPANGKKS